MHSSNWRDHLLRHPRIEPYESRLLMTIQPLADLHIDSFEQQPETDHELLALATSDITGLAAARAAYGFTGIGQTVVVIDSGIAYDHAALGGGFGAGYRVVGGWDFTGENDANPYDDGPAGSHGTHVAGIIGSSDTNNLGVAPGADLVALRVFDDSGNGSFDWVEKALRWVHQNRNSFANPITTVNLSIGTAWNSSSLPNWAMLEDEFKQLEADGIFIAVAAGNSFATYSTPGLSYPAVSSYVVPVSSVDSDGNLSNFSQRNERVIAAPGRAIRSTVPDYVGNFNGKTDDFATFSGTSMAAPFVAGASVLLRQALEFTGVASINQDMIYELMRNTADTVFDPVTNRSYFRLNLGRALDAVMPDDDYGSTADTAYNLGTLSRNSISGVLERLNDRDYFTFTASQSGAVKLTVTNSSNSQAVWDVIGNSGAVDGNQLSFQVVAGQKYTFGLSGGSLSSYSIKVDVSTEMVDWGTIEFKQLAGQAVAGDTWYAMTASRSGVFTAEAIFAQAGGNIDIELYNADKQKIGASSSSSGSERVDIQVKAGDVLYLRVKGTNNNVDFRLTNLITQIGSTLGVAGTRGADTFEFTAGATHQIKINGVAYAFSGGSVRNIVFIGGEGDDAATFVGTAAKETATFRPDAVEFSGLRFSVRANLVESVTVHGGLGIDSAIFYDSAGDDTLVAKPQETSISGPGYSHAAHGFEVIDARAIQGGFDQAYLYDSTGRDVLTATPTYAQLTGKGYTSTARGFDRTEAQATAGGQDVAYLYDSAGNDKFTGTPSYAEMTGTGFVNAVRGFQRVEAAATYGTDIAYLFDSAANDIFKGTPTIGELSGSGFINVARGFDRIDATSSAGGRDTAYLFDSSGNDTFIGNGTFAELFGNGFDHIVRNFERVEARSSKGIDTAKMTVSANDLVISLANSMTVSGADFSNLVAGFRHAQNNQPAAISSTQARFLKALDLVFKRIGE